MDHNSVSENKSGPERAGGFRQTAFIVVASAHCLYRPDPRAAVRIIPPYGTEVKVVEESGNWALIEYCGKEAWSPRENLSDNLVPVRDAVIVGAKPIPSVGSWSAGITAPSFRTVEIGPRGGRFVRTSGGFKRYF